MTSTQYKHFIIAGTEKAGTTSVFSYLSGHPEIFPSRVKETDFFRQEHLGSNEDYLSYFEGCPSSEMVLMEASPGYLSEAEKVSGRLQAALSEAKLLFILRDPVERLISSFRFHVGRLNIDDTISLDEYVTKCFAYYRGEATPEQLGIGKWYLQTLEQGLYAKKLSHFREMFPESQISVMFLDDLIRNTHAFMCSVCVFVGIDSSYFNNFTFHRENVTFFGKNKALHKAAILVNNFFEPFFRKNPAVKRLLLSWYKTFNASESKLTPMSPSVRSQLEDFYLSDKEQLLSMLGGSEKVSVRWLQGDIG
ncbi:MAG: sulfotransferase domain-containing protein [Desulfobulbaceae bacterium]|nr:sulfotransferase domain-containing protein [Desulfobulbaceae bacterium]HIJ91200.1 hypothetical protein [Deltaproteobacteria bacterium]